VAGNLKDMLLAIEAVGNDLEWRGRVAAPTILVGRMTVAGT
jgi:PmbA protein